MNNRGVKTGIVLLLSCWWAFLSAQPQPAFLDRYIQLELDMDSGLPCNYVDDVLVDSAGFLWIATSGGGLCRYDGYELLTLNSSGSPALKSNFVRNMVEDRFHRLWVASEGGLDVLDLASFSLAAVELPFSGPVEQPVCSMVALDATGALWAKFGTVLYRAVFAPDGSLADVRSFEDPRLHPVNFFFKDVEGNGSVWLRLGEGLCRLVPSAEGGLEAQAVVPTLRLGADTYVADFLSTDARVWMATEDGLYQIYKGTGEWKLYVTDPENPRSLTQNFVSSLAMTPDGQLLVSTLHGLNIYNPVTDNFERAGQDVINGVKTTADHVLVGTETRGLLILSDKPIEISHFVHNPGDPSSVAQGAVNAIWQEPGGRLWVGHVEGGLSIREPGETAFRHLTRERGNLAHNSVSALRPGPDGNLYVGTWGGGIDVVSAREPFRVLAHLPEHEGLTEYIGVLEYDMRNGLLWVGSNRGVFLYNPASRSYTPALEEEVTGCIGSCIDSSGLLWMGCVEGLYVFDLTRPGPDGRFPYTHYRYKLDAPETRIDEKICCILEAADGDRYLGSNGGGLYRAHRLEDGSFSFTGFSVRDGLSNDRVRGFCEDASGCIWISTEHGLNRLDPKTGVNRPFLRRDGLQSDRFHWNNACQGTDGLLYFGHAEGFSAVNPVRYAATGIRGPLRFTRVQVGERSMRDPFLRRLDLHERERDLRFQFAVLSVDGQALVRYQTFLEGYEKGWQDVPESGHPEKTYSALPDGRYTFHVRALGGDGAPLDSISLDVRVKPYFYRTWWFRLLGVFLLLGLAWEVILWRTRALRRRQAVLEETVRERTLELRRQNEVLRHQNEELASRRMLHGLDAASDRPEDQFTEKAMDCLRQLYKDPALDVQGLCQAMGVSKTLLNMRMQESIGLSTGQFIRKYRLSVAREMLQNDHSLNVSEVAYEVGFNDPKYFTRCFSKEFGITPSSLGKE